MSSIWTQELTDRLVELREAGHSFGSIAEMMGVTRDQAIGRAYRIGLCGAITPTIKVPRQPKMPKVKREPVAILPLDPATVTPFTEAKPGQCRWMVNETDVCGGACCEGSSSWCGYHYGIVFVQRRAA